jgi:hypothetical protein
MTLMPNQTAGRIVCIGLAIAALLRGGAPARAAEPIHFNRDIAPILSNNCFYCHGPDKNKRKADMRLDTKAGLFGKLEEGIPVVPGDVANSMMVQRITSKDPDETMPPPKANKHLSAAQIDLLKQWVAQGAQWEPHWSFIAPQRPAVPAVKQTGWVRNPIDAFILARLEQEGLAPSKEADKTTLIRRVTLDLTGLPPTPGEVDDFLADTRPDAYERVVDRLLANPHYGERMALDWLDAARYADTHGYHIDAGRDQTRWRQWVIDAFNRNEPFDQFTIEQLAGDLLPNATVEQKIATGFVRNNMVNFEGGAIPEEYRTAYVIDRVNTTGTVFLGLTVGCTQCHDHKFDPMTQKEFYQLFAYYNNVPENGLDGSKGNAAPVLTAATPDQQKHLDELSAAQKAVERQLDAPIAGVDAAQAEWERATPTAASPAWIALEASVMKSAGGASLAQQDDKSILVTGPNPPSDTYTIVAPVELEKVTAIRVEALTEPHLTANGPGRSENGNAVLTGLKVAPADKAGAAVKMRSASADFTQDGFAVANVIAERRERNASKAGWALYPEVGKQHEAVFEFEQPLKTSVGTRISVTLEFKSPYAQHQFGRFRLSVTDAPAPASAKMPDEVARALVVPAANRTDAQQAVIRAYYRENVSPIARDLRQQLASLKKEQKEIESALPNTMVMAEMDKPRDTFVLMRGQYDKPGERVFPGVPAFLPPLALPDGARNDRLALARWIVAPNQPLTARVIVNRYWQSFFGTGIVKTAEDFGTQGEQPSHPELLDWLAVEFSQSSGQLPVASGQTEGSSLATSSSSLATGHQPLATSSPWNVKQMVRLIVTSAAYRQSSAITADKLAADPENRLLSRGPRFRLAAEFIRDQALAAAGLLDDRIGGASVSPYQPAGLWSELMSRSDGRNWTAQVYQQSHGADLYRRTMYTFWKRSSPPPSLSTFDAPDREVCVVRRARTNTPLQALVLMNDPTYVEASRKLAERMMHEGQTPEDRIACAFRLVLARKPSADESAVLKGVFDRQAERYRDDKPAAEKLLSVGEMPRDASLDVAELAAWANVASVILNLDEAVTRG